VAEDRNTILEGLFRTEAVQVSPADAPFWYTSGKFGPYYVNTHYLIGGRKSAEEALAVIDAAVADKGTCPRVLTRRFREAYRTDPTYRATIDALCQTVRSLSSDLPFDAISGGERRDWYFSLLLAEALSLPHVSLFKDGAAVWTDAGTDGAARALAPLALSGLRVLHVVDIVTEASSYVRAWIPSLRSLGAVFEDTLAVVDRVQGGTEVLATHGVRLHSLARITTALFREATDAGLVDEAQYDMVLRFTQDPDAFRKDFLATYPDFLEKTLAAGGKNAEKARLGLEKGYV
jgi:orotate phosphoribosyltransferase